MPRGKPKATANLFTSPEVHFKGMTTEDLHNRFTYHAPKPQQQEKYEEIRFTAREFAKLLNEQLPESREKSMAFTALEEAVFWANAAVARHD